MRDYFGRLGVMLTILLLSVTGCATTTPFQPVSPAGDTALIYVFRPQSLLSRGTIIKVTINGAERGLLVDNGYVALQEQAGQKNIVLLTNGLVENKYDALTMTTEPGQTYYIKAEPGVFGAFTLKQLDAATGAQEISGTQMYHTN